MYREKARQPKVGRTEGTQIDRSHRERREGVRRPETKVLDKSSARALPKCRSAPFVRSAGKTHRMRASYSFTQQFNIPAWLQYCHTHIRVCLPFHCSFHMYAYSVYINKRNTLRFTNVSPEYRKQFVITADGHAVQNHYVLMNFSIIMKRWVLNIRQFLVLN